MSVWGESKIPYIFSIDVNKPYLYDLDEVLPIFEKAEANIIANRALSQSDSLRKVK